METRSCRLRPFADSTCEHCGERTALICTFGGLGLTRRRHQQRCAAAKAALRADELGEAGQLAVHLLGASVSPNYRSPSMLSTASTECPPSRMASGLLWHGGGSSSSSGAWGLLSGSVRSADGASVSTPVAEEAFYEECLSGRAEDASIASGEASTWASVIARRPVAAAVVAVSAIWLEAPIVAGSVLIASAALLWSGRRARGELSAAAEELRPLLQAAAPAMPLERHPSSLAVPSEGLADEIVHLVREFRVRAALGLAEREGILGTLAAPGEPLELGWLKRLAAPAASAAAGCRVPPSGEGWQGPIESCGSGWQMELWYRWTTSTVITTVSRLLVPGDLTEALSIFREADLVHNWLPFVTGGDCSWSEDMPALLTSIRAKIPILPRSITTLIHRAFLDGFEGSGGPGGVQLVEWTPGHGETVAGRYCGMTVPTPPARSSEMQVQLATTVVEPAGQNRCNIVMAGQNDFKVSKRLVPDAVLRRFLAMNSRVLGQRICSCLGDMSGRGYRARIEADQQGFYALVRQRSAEHAAKAGSKRLK